MSTTLKKLQLNVLRKTGFKYLRAKSRFNVPYIISLGDFFSQDTFYNPKANCGEIISCIAWCMGKNEPVIFDIGAHCGYFSTHFAVLLKNENPGIYSFEPITYTYRDLLETVKRLQLEQFIKPIPAAISDKHEIVSMNYSKWTSMFAQVNRDDKNNFRSGSDILYALSTTLNDVVNRFNKYPDLIKIDVEGYETYAMRGADKIFSNSNKPAICIEWNPEALQQCGSSAKELSLLLEGYEFYFLNDFEGNKRKFLDKIEDVSAISWVSNLFAIPIGSPDIDKWKSNIKVLIEKYKLEI